MRRPAHRPLSALVLGLLFAGGCVSTGNVERPPDERFGHRPEGGGPLDRELVYLAPADSVVEYFHYPAPFDSVHVRAAPFAEDAAPELQRLPVEVLVKGSFPDACTELHDLEQDRTGHIVNATLEIRKPQGAVCAAVLRPYRFYFMLPGEYGPGHYTLKLNDRVIPFQITAPLQD